MLQNNRFSRAIVDSKHVLILSGEGERGSFARYNGKRTERAIRSRLTRERCHGDRFARLFVDDEGSVPGTIVEVSEADWSYGDRRTVDLESIR